MNYNTMCKSCSLFGNECKGTSNTVYSGCIYKVECKKEENTMLKSQFAQEVAKRVDGEVTEVEKANGIIRTGIQPTSGTIRPVVYIDDFYNDGLSVDDTAKRVANAMRTHAMDAPTEWINDFESVKPKLRARLYNQKTYAEVKRSAGHGFDDLVIVPYIDKVLECPDGTGCIKVSNELLKIWNVTAEEVIDIAMENTAGEVNMYPMSDIFGDDAPDLTVLSVKDNQFGAIAVIILFHTLKKMYPDGFVVLPSSVHEVIVTGITDGMDMLDAMVNEVNDAEVDPMEQLSNHAYKVA